MARKSKENAGKPRIITKEVIPTLKPTVPGKVTIVADPAVGHYLRILQGTPGVITEYILHHPVGVTDLQDDDWVLSDPSELAHLVARKEDPFAERRATEMKQFIETEARKISCITTDANGLAEYANVSQGTRADFLDLLAKEKKATTGKWNRSNWLSKSSDRRATWEKLFDDAKARAQVEFESKNPNNYRTRGGPRKDVDQVALDWAKGLDLAQLKDQIFLSVLNGPPSDALATDVETPSVVAFATPKVTDTAPAKPTGAYLDFSSLTGKDKKSVKNHVGAIRKILRNNGFADAEVAILNTASP